MKLNNEKEIFDLYVEKDTDLRQTLKEPFIQENDGRVWASEGHILIMVNQECVSGEYKTQDLGSKIPVREYNCDCPFSVSACLSEHRVFYRRPSRSTYTPQSPSI